MKSISGALSISTKLVFVLALSPAAFAGDDTTVMTTHQQLIELSESLPAEITPSSVKNIPQFCQVNGIRDFKESFGVQKVEAGNGGWSNSFDATRESREIAFLLYFGSERAASLQTAEQRAGAYTRALAQLKANSGAISSDEQRVLQRGLKYIQRMVSPQESSTSVGLSQTGYLCSDLTLLDVFSCSRGAKKLAQLAQAYGLEEGAMNMLPLWKDVIADPSYMAVFKKVSLKIVENLQAGAIPSSTLFQDLVSEFSAVTDDAGQAEEHAWSTMALIASGGGNINIRPLGIHKWGTETREDLKRSELADLLWVLSNGAMALDQVTVQRGFLYSFPSAVNNVCDYGKGYHFWMTAYFAHYLRADGYKPGVAAAAAYTLEKGYQFIKLGAGRDPTKPFSQPLYSNYNNNIRLDLSLAAAGAWYGAASLSTPVKSLSRAQVEQGIQLSFAGSNARNGGAAVSQDEFRNLQPTKLLSLYSEWKSIINPDAAYKFFGQAVAP